MFSPITEKRRFDDSKGKQRSTVGGDAQPAFQGRLRRQCLPNFDFRTLSRSISSFNI